MKYPLARPELEPQNAEAVYQYYDDRIREFSQRGGRFILKAALNLSPLWYKPVVDFPESARQRVAHRNAFGNGLIVASNHRSYEDFGVMAAIIGREPELRKLTERHFALAKVKLFASGWKGPLENPVIRTVVEQVGGVPVFRKKDVEKSTAGRRNAVDALVKMSSELVTDSYNVLIFPHGTVYRGEGIGNTETGIGRIAVRVAQLSQRPAEILPIGIHYPDEEHRRRSYVAIGEPFEAQDSVEETLRLTEDQLLAQYQRAQQLAE